MSEMNRQNAGIAVSNAIADAVEQAGAFTVLVNARRRLPSSGVLFAPGLVLTADHTVEREEGISVTLPDGSQASAALAGRDRGADLAVLRLQGVETSTVAAQPDAVGARVGHLVVAVGRPSEEGIQASIGMITAVGSNLRTMRGGLLAQYLVTDAVPYPGFSGGPLVNLAGQLVGLNTSGLVHGSSLAIPAGLAWEVARSLAEHGHIRRGYLGIRSQVVEIPQQAREAQGGGQSEGLLVVGVEPEGPSGQAGGLMVGDILVGLNGQPVSDHDDLLSRLSGDLVGQQVAVQVLRGGQPQVVHITVGERK